VIHGADGLRFTCAVTVQPAVKLPTPDFAGAFVHGPAGARFLYLGWRPPGGDWIRRWKIPLPMLTWASVEGMRSRPTAVLEATIVDMQRVTVLLVGAGWRVRG